MGRPNCYVEAMMKRQSTDYDVQSSLNQEVQISAYPSSYCWTSYLSLSKSGVLRTYASDDLQFLPFVDSTASKTTGGPIFGTACFTEGIKLSSIITGFCN